MQLLWLIITLLCAYQQVNAHEASLCVGLCPPCLPQRLVEECPQLPDCPHKVKEPGCGCCLVCALREGERCGVRLPHCAEGLKCLNANRKFRLIDIMNNRASCQRATSNREEVVNSSYSRGSRQTKRKRVRRHPHGGLLSPLNHNGPCSRHYENLMTSCGYLPAKAWLPDCDNRGFYAPKQCMSSGGTKPPKCWCAHKNGQAIEGTPFTTTNLYCHV